MKLEPGEVICSQCHGTGYPNNNTVKEYELRFNFVPKVCDKCYGTGKLDWIENVVGKRTRPDITITKMKINPIHRTLKDRWKII